jgi:ABC-type uncharacterized transport system permease subunit
VLYFLIETPQGQNLDWRIMLSFTCWLMNGLTLLISIKRPIQNLCVLTYPLSAFSLLLALGFSQPAILITKDNPEMLVHIFISFFAISWLALANFQAILMSWQNYLLKHHHPSPILRILPPVQTMETFLFTIIVTGMLFLSGSLISGFHSPKMLLSPLVLPKTVLSLLAFVLLTLLLMGRFLFGWRGKTATRLTIMGSIFALAAYFGTKALLL